MKKVSLLLLFLAALIIIGKVEIARGINDNRISAEIGVKTLKETTPYLKSELNIPVVRLSEGNKIQESINKTLFDDAINFKAQVGEEARKSYEKLVSAGIEVRPFEVLTQYTIHNLVDILSLRVTYYQYSGGAHGISSVVPYNYDLNTGKRLMLKDLFKEGYDFKTPINNIINSEFNKNPENYFQNAFKGIGDNQDFYIGKEGLVIYFQNYDIAPFAAGNPEFIIPYKDIKDGLIVKVN